MLNKKIMSEVLQKQPIIITGFPHSGTSMLSRIIGGHPDSFLITELKAFGKDGAKIHAPEDKSGINDCLLWWDNFSYPIWDKSGEPSIREPILNEEGIFNVKKIYEEKLSGKRLVIKNPEFLNRVHVLKKMFPGAFVVVCVRNPFHSIQSMTVGGNEKFMLLTQRHYGLADDLFLKAANSWKECIDIYKDAKNENWIAVKYEDVVFNPRQTFEKLFQFLGIEDSGYIEKACRIPKDLKHNYYYVKSRLTKSAYKDEILDYIKEGSEMFRYSLDFSNIRSDRLSYYFERVYDFIKKIKPISRLRKIIINLVKLVISKWFEIFKTKEKFIKPIIFSALSQKADVLLVSGDVINNAQDAIQNGNNIVFEILEREFFRLRGSKKIVLLNSDFKYAPSVILKNIEMYPNENSQNKKVYFVMAKVLYARDEFK